MYHEIDEALVARQKNRNSSGVNPIFVPFEALID